MPNYGWTTNGLVIPEIGDAATPGTILGDLAAAQRAMLDPNLDVEADAPMGQLNGVWAERERLVWESLQVASDGFNPDAAEDFQLDSLSAVTGTRRSEATHSKVTVSMSIDANKTVPAGTTFANSLDTTIQFTLDADVTSTTAGNYPGSATCTELGRVLCNAGLLTIIQTPVTGLNSVTNPHEAIPGQERDDDPELRIRRLDELEASGAGTVDTIQAAIFKIENDDGSKPVLDCIVPENVEDYPSADGQPAHSIEAIVWDGPGQNASNDVIAQTIFDKKPGGTLAYGSSSGTAKDTNVPPKPHTIFFTRPGIINNKIAITIETDIANPQAYTGDVALKTALAAEFTARVTLGVTEIRCTNYVRAALGVAGILDVTNIQIGNMLVGPFPPNLQNFDIPARTKCLLDTSNITITRIQVVP